MSHIKRQYHRWFSSRLDRAMEMLSFTADGTSGNSHGGVPILIFPNGDGRFYQFEDEGMVQAVSEKIGNGQVQLYCVDAINEETWFNPRLNGQEKIARQNQYEAYILEEVLPMIESKGAHGGGLPHLAAVGCGFGGYHAVNMALRHPDKFTSFLSLGGHFDQSHLLHGHMDEECYLNLPTHYIPNLSDAWYLDRYRHNTYILATGEHDHCWNENERLAEILRTKHIPCRLDVWGNGTGHGWQWWPKMLAHYL